MRKENYTNLFKVIKNGLVNGVKVVDPIKNSNKFVSTYKTHIIRRKSTAPATDTYSPIKRTNDGNILVPPTTTEPPSFR